MSYSQHVEELRRRDPAVAEWFADFHSVRQVFAWMHAGGRKPAVDLIAQDEFEHDFLVEMEDGRWAVFGMT